MKDTMHTFVPDELKRREASRLMLSVVAPRPIAWVSTIGTNGVSNLAPFSFFNGVGSFPPIVMFAIGPRRGQTKDTLRNLRETPEFVVNIVDEELADAMNLTAGDWPPGISEFDMAELEPASSVDVKPPRVAAAPIAMETKLIQLVPVDDTENTIVLGRVLRYHMREGLLRPNGLVDAELVRPIARLGGNEYTTLGTVFELTRPSIEDRQSKG